MPGMEALSAEPTAVKSGFGTLGRLVLSEVLRLDFCVLPPRRRRGRCGVPSRRAPWARC
ncbi:hypothetical protein QEG98_27425 [Myxococcus sp. MxC21-1]|nr:hypothetical protein [Myxococcus sp. MxC21-1]WNZ59747.1 hypothetical protein QEG98_27425 [Myxococcus sp. MxC21-1]